jgi:UDP-glucuronate 4-epimerase
MKILVTGSAGFIGAALTQALLARGDQVVGLDNHNNYYEVSLKEDRLKQFIKNTNYIHLQLDLSSRMDVEKLFADHLPQRVVNLAAQAGVRYSLENPLAYIDSNIVGFAHILEGCRNHGVEHFVYASSSSVYGANTAMPNSEHHNVDHPLSLYAASKKSNELMAHTYSHLFNIPTTGLRFFTVYGPWSRPDMAMIKFAKAILSNNPIDIYNNGQHRRDFTYIDDVIQGIICALDHPAVPNLDWSSQTPDAASSNVPWRVYNVGSNRPVALLDCITILENALGKAAIKNFLPIQPGDMLETYANVENIMEDLGYFPKIRIEDGIKIFAEWFLKYYTDKT